MSATASKNAKLLFTVGSTPTQLGEVSDFSIETARGTIDVSTLASEWQEFITGQGSWSGSINGFYDPTDPAQADLVNKALAGTMCTITVQPLGVGAGKTQLSGNCFIPTTGWNFAKEDASTISFTFQGSGALTLVANAS
ncbi:MAG: phage tail tube protein [Synergistaceae bacterium]